VTSRIAVSAFTPPLRPPFGVISVPRLSGAKLSEGRLRPPFQIDDAAAAIDRIDDRRREVVDRRSAARPRHARQLDVAANRAALLLWRRRNQAEGRDDDRHSL